MMPTTTPATGSAHTACAIAAPLIGAARASGSRVEKAMPVASSLRRSAAHGRQSSGKLGVVILVLGVARADHGRMILRHCEPTGPARSGRPDDRLREAIQSFGLQRSGLLRRYTPRNDEDPRKNHP